MAATETRPAAAIPHAEGDGSAAAITERTPPGTAALALGLGVAVTYAMFANGAVGLPEESRLQVGVAALAFAALAGLLFGRNMRFAPAPLAAGGLALLAGFAAWSALSIAWSVAPDESWLEFNRGIAYALVVAIALTLGSSLPRAAERIALGYLVIVTAAAMYALGGKLFPGLDIGPIDFNHTERFSRLRAPLEYWNALGLVCAMGVPIAVRVAMDVGYRARRRAAGSAALVVLLVTLGLTYSRGTLLVLFLALTAQVALGPGRARLAATVLVGLVGALPAFLVGIMRDDLTADGVPVAARNGDGAILAVALLAGIAIALVLGRMLASRGEPRPLGPRGLRRARRAALAAAVLIPIVVLVGLASSERGVRGTISHQASEFTKAKFDRQNDPARVLKTNSGNRWIWWEEAVGAFWDRPLVGYGAGSFPLVHRLYRDNRIEVRQPHNVPLEFLSETGLVGAGLGLGGLALLGIAAFRTTRARAPGREAAFAGALLVGAGAWSLHTLVDWDWDIPGVTLPALIFLGILAARPPGTARNVRAAGGRLGRSPALALGAVLALAVAALAALPSIAKDLTREALTVAEDGSAESLREGGRKAALAKRLNPFSVEPVLAQAAIAERGNQPAAAAGLLVEAVERQPDNPTVWARLGRFQVLVDDTAAALESLTAATRLDPATAEIYAVARLARFDERRSATATGTPLPLVLGAGPVATPPGIPGAPAIPTPPPALRTPRPPTPDVPGQPQPPTTPTPPRQPPTPPPSGAPFRLEG